MSDLADVPVYADYARYRPFLRHDFLQRCAYCERPGHAVESGGGVLRWKTVCGRFTIDAIRLNREVLTCWRAKRAEMRERIAHFEDLTAELRGAIAFRDAAARRMIQERIKMIAGFVADARRLYGL